MLIKLPVEVLNNFNVLKYTIPDNNNISKFNELMNIGLTLNKSLLIDIIKNLNNNVTYLKNSDTYVVDSNINNTDNTSQFYYYSFFSYTPIKQ